MPKIPVRVGDRTALIEKPEKPGCSSPWCGFPDAWRCSYPVIRDGKPEHCDAKLCTKHATKVKGGHLCQPHARLMERVK